MALIICKDCAQEFSTDAEICPKCGAKRYRPRYVLKGFMVLFFVSWIIAHYSHPDAGAAVNVPSTSNTVAVPTNPQWQYASEKDDMTGKSVATASIDSSNTFSFDFPYQGEQQATLMLRTHPRYGKNVIFSIEKGQFMCHIDGCSVLVRFDDAPPVRFSASGPSDNSTTYILLSGYPNFFSKMSAAKKVRIEANIYHNGAQTAEFDVSHFDSRQYK